VQQFFERFANLKEKIIGIAPFARWDTKIWPLSKMEDLIGRLNDTNRYSIFLFGAGEAEINQIETWQKMFPNVHSGTVGDLYNEISLMSKLDLFLSMDSANMHLASLSGIPVISIWGPTHPLAGFSPIHQDSQNMVEIPIDVLNCRPCSIFGDRPCWRGDHACMERIKIDDVFGKIENVLNI